MPEENPFFEEDLTDEQITQELEKANEKAYLKRIGKRNKGFLVNLTPLERENVAEFVCDRYEDNKGKHKELCDRIDKFDEVYRMDRSSESEDELMPTYRLPISTVALEVIHSNIMNVFFTPSSLATAIPVEEGDVAKVGKLSDFMNWSVSNELDIFTQFDRLNHATAKNGETPYIVSWCKEYGVDIEREPIDDPANPGQPLFDEDGNVVFQEREVEKLLYNGPKLEVFSRKDYIQPENAVMGETPEWEIRRIRMSYDQYLRAELEGKMYKGSIKEIKDWSDVGISDDERKDTEGESIPLGKFNKEFLEFYGRIRVKVVKDGEDGNDDEFEELEDEYIALVEPDSCVLCQLRKNRFPLKMRPIGLDYFIPDDDGRRKGFGVMEFMEDIQSSYDKLFNQYLAGVVNSNSGFGFFDPTGNKRRESMEFKMGTLYPSSNPNSVNMIQFPAPNSTIQIMLQLINQWAQLLFGISDFAAGMESTIDPDAPAKKAQLIVSQGNVRMNMLIRRKNATLKDILKRWFLLYKENMPKNKFMRIVGSGENPWKFVPVGIEDFALKDIPDFELTGNVLNANKSLELSKAMAVYQVLSANPFFSPQTSEGLQSLHALTKWLVKKFDETGLENFLPSAKGEFIQTPEEENARMLQGDVLEPGEDEDHINHIRVHNEILVDPSIPEEIKEQAVQHIQKHQALLKSLLTQQILLQQSQGGQVGFGQEQGQGVFQGGNPSAGSQGNFAGESASVDGLEGRDQVVASGLPSQNGSARI